MGFCKNLKRIRTEKGFETAKDFTERGLKGKIKYTTYVAYESCRLPSEENIILIASALQVRIDDLFGYNVSKSTNNALDNAFAVLKALPITTKKNIDNKEVEIYINGKNVASIPNNEIIDIIDEARDRFTRSYITNMNRRLYHATILDSIIAYGMTGRPALKSSRLAAKLTVPSKSDNNKSKKTSPRKAKKIQKKNKDIQSRIEV